MRVLIAVMIAAVVVAALVLLISARADAPHRLLPARYSPLPLGSSQPVIPGVTSSP